MREDLKYPSIDAIKSVLKKLGIDPSSRCDNYDQDCEYTTCKVEELESYVKLYSKSETSIYEKRVLGCYFLECLNEYVQEHEIEHPLQNNALQLLFTDKEIHESEIEYWADTSESNEEYWWPITKYLVN